MTAKRSRAKRGLLMLLLRSLAKYTAMLGPNYAIVGEGKGNGLVVSPDCATSISDVGHNCILYPLACGHLSYPLDQDRVGSYVTLSASTAHFSRLPEDTISYVVQFFFEAMSPQAFGPQMRSTSTASYTAGALDEHVAAAVGRRIVPGWAKEFAHRAPALAGAREYEGKPNLNSRVWNQLAIRDDLEVC